MQRKTSKIFTYQTRLFTDDKQDKELIDCSFLLSKVKRELFKAYTQGQTFSFCKSPFLKRFGITARQFNSCRIELEGKIASYKEGLSERISDLKTKILKLKKHIRRLKDPSKIHQKKRRLFLLENKLIQLQNDKRDGRVRLCFGGKAFFHKQFALEENGFQNHEEWKKEWESERNSSFFLVGSKDETAGNQSAQLKWHGGSYSLNLRLPNSFSEKTLTFHGINFAYGHKEILACLEENEKRKKLKSEKKEYASYGKAVNIRLKRDKKSWIIFVSTEKEKPTVKSKKAYGTIGIDINAEHIALSETDRFGNLINKKIVPCSTYGKSKNARSAIIGNACKQIIDEATKVQKPIVVEILDFQKKKQELREKGNKYSRMLSSFAYKQILTNVKSKAFKEGTEVYEVNPAFTSIIGKVKFAKKYGLSTHLAAALVIARRVNYFSEKPPSCSEIQSNLNLGSAFSVPVWNPEKHVFSFYSALKKKIKAAHVVHSPMKSRSYRRDSRSASENCKKKSVLGKNWGDPKFSQFSDKNKH